MQTSKTSCVPPFMPSIVHIRLCPPSYHTVCVAFTPEMSVINTAGVPFHADGGRLTRRSLAPSLLPCTRCKLAYKHSPLAPVTHLICPDLCNLTNPILSLVMSSTVTSRVPRAAIEAFSRYGGQALKSTYNPVTGKWRKAIVSPRIAAKVRKEAIRTDCVGVGQMWDPVWDLQTPKLQSLRAPKGHLRDRNREKRAVAIEDNMAKMEKKIEEYREAVEARKPTPGIETLFKRMVARTR